MEGERETRGEREGDAALLQRTAALPYCFLACEPLHGEQMGLREINARENEGEGDASGKRGVNTGYPVNRPHLTSGFSIRGDMLSRYAGTL